MIEAVIFDWGGTLSEYVPIEMIDVWRLAARHLAPEREEELCARLVAVEEAFWASTATHQRSGRLADLLAEASRQLGLDVTDAVLEEAATHHLDAWTPHIRHDPEAGPTLAALRRRGLRIGLLSNTHWPRTFHEHFLERDGLDGLIDVRLYTSELAYQKPHPSAFAAALEALGVDEPSRAVFVGDRPWDDIVGSKRVGMRAVLRHNPLVEDHPDAHPDAVVTRLAEVLDVVDAWRRR
jgi:putative hydrolase of the HAD superfamily